MPTWMAMRWRVRPQDVQPTERDLDVRIGKRRQGFFSHPKAVPAGRPKTDRSAPVLGAAFAAADLVNASSERAPVLRIIVVTGMTIACHHGLITRILGPGARSIPTDELEVSARRSSGTFLAPARLHSMHQMPDRLFPPDRRGAILPRFGIANEPGRGRAAINSK